MSNSELEKPAKDDIEAIARQVIGGISRVDAFFRELADIREGELGRNDPTNAFLKALCDSENPQYLEVRHEIGKAKVDGVEVPIYDKLWIATK